MTYQWRRRTIAETLERIRADPPNAWVAMGNFLDDWRRSAREDRLSLVQEPLPPAEEDREIRRWAALCAAAVDWLCWKDGLNAPEWTGAAEFRLADPWFLYPGEKLRAWQLATTPAPFKMRNVFGGDQVLDRV